MNGPFDVSTEFRWEDAGGLRGCGGLATFRLSCRTKDASVLLHEIDPNNWPNIQNAEFLARIPDFSEPFITNFQGTVEVSERTFLVEPLPPSVSLLDIWRAILQSNPSQAMNMLRQVIAQLNRLLRQQADRCEVHGAVCAANVVLTDQRTYGLLAARLGTIERDIWLRRLEFTSPATRQATDSFSPTGPPETIARILLDLLEIEADLEALSVQDRSELHRLCEPYTTQSQPFAHSK